MFDWLFEGHMTVYVLLAAALVGLLFAYWLWRGKPWLYAVAVVAALIGVYWLLDRVVETDREQVERKVGEMATAVQANNLDALFEHISDNFRSPGGKSKPQLREFAAGHAGSVTELVVWDFRFEGKPLRGQDFNGVRFRFKVKPSPFPADPWFDCRPVFEYSEATKQWRLKGFKVFKPDPTEEIPLPF